MQLGGQQHDGRSQLGRLLTRIRMRLWARAALGLLSLAVAAAVVLAAALALVHRFLFPLPPTVGLVCALPLLAGMLVCGLRRRPGDAEAAALLDHRLRSDDLFAAASDQRALPASRRAGAAVVLLARAERRARAVHGRDLVSISSPVAGLTLALALPVGLAAVLILMGPGMPVGTVAAGIQPAAREGPRDATGEGAVARAREAVLAAAGGPERAVHRDPSLPPRIPGLPPSAAGPASGPGGAGPGSKRVLSPSSTAPRGAGIAGSGGDSAAIALAAPRGDGAGRGAASQGPPVAPLPAPGGAPRQVPLPRRDGATWRAGEGSGGPIPWTAGGEPGARVVAAVSGVSGSLPWLSPALRLYAQNYLSALGRRR